MIERYFSRAAVGYPHAATVQARIAEHLADHFFPVLQPPVRILELGCGTGTLTRRLRRAYPEATIHACDLSPDMIATARSELTDAAINWIVFDMDRLEVVSGSEPLGGSYDLIATSTALHWSNSWPRLLQSLQGRLTHGGYLVASMMTAGTLSELHRLRYKVAPHKTPAATLPSIAEIRDVLESIGAADPRLETLEYAESFSDMRELWRFLKQAAFTGGKFARGPAGVCALSRQELRQLEEQYSRCWPQIMQDLKASPQDAETPRQCGVVATFEAACFALTGNYKNFQNHKPPWSVAVIR